MNGITRDFAGHNKDFILNEKRKDITTLDVLTTSLLLQIKNESGQKHRGHLGNWQ